MNKANSIVLIFLCLLSLGSITEPIHAQEVGQYQHWLELAAADQVFADRSVEIGRTAAFLEFLGENSVVFRAGGPLDARDLYSSESFQRAASEIRWEAHYVDVSRDGDMGLTVGPVEALDQSFFGHLVSIWQKNQGRWELMADLNVVIPGYLSLEVEPNFDDFLPVLEETSNPELAAENTLQDLIDADDLFGRALNFRGGQRALLRYGLENSRVYLPGMAAAVGAEAASSVYGAFLDEQLSTVNEISSTYVGGYLSSSKEMGYTYGIMSTNTEETYQGFQASYMRLWRYTESDEWKIAVEVVSPFGG
ncbi:MAG: hypothetical protein HOF74_05350 [Gammaproteobacteria bacterium]|jgi:hypothetical protein|nr:hypothetical protein [Gammaproteobacteria bacterium]MBT3859236.1 hypothetical protein [Gammaproteobacteria bacterium]MBT3988104.1 hypothetical protein [Gammaproteobacteria bacterium]MBT4256673.1 hypothetical protein [Gammaproteobacteria bacterium]MBT4583035.1 hypothetical protein [Gammaproteobacteria bacterium]